MKVSKVTLSISGELIYISGKLPFSAEEEHEKVLRQLILDKYGSHTSPDELYIKVKVSEVEI